MRVRAVVVALVFVVFAPHPAAARGCGETADPHWLLITTVGIWLISEDDGLIDSTDRPAAKLIRACDIKEVESGAGAGGARISLYSLPAAGKVRSFYIVVKETPQQICKMLPRCSDATQVPTSGR